jgi:hypothetical protein
MWRYFLLLVVLATSSAISPCDTVQFTVPPADIGIIYTPDSSGPGDFTSDVFDGIALTGEVLSFDAVLSDGVLARFGNCIGACGVSVGIFTNAPFTFTEFAGPSSTGSVLDPNGNQGATQLLGRAGGNNGAIFTGVVVPGPNEDVSGAHFDIVLPNTGFEITGLELSFVVSSDSESLKFGTAEQLPEPSTFGLTAMGLLILAVLASASTSRR